jgi:hypothetical protein
MTKCNQSQTLEEYRKAGRSSEAIFFLDRMKSHHSSLGGFLERYRYIQPDGELFSERSLRILMVLHDLENMIEDQQATLRDMDNLRIEQEEVFCDMEELLWRQESTLRDTEDLIEAQTNVLGDMKDQFQSLIDEVFKRDKEPKIDFSDGNLF